MSVTADMLRRLGALNLAPEAMCEVLSILADVASKDDERKARDRERKRRVRGHSTDIPQTVHGKGAEIPADKNGAVVEDNTPLEIMLPMEATSHPPKPPSSPRGTRISADFKARQAERDVAVSLGWCEAEIDDELERFRDYWLARAGKEARKVDWDRTFRNRIKDVNDRRKRAPPLRNGNGGETAWQRQKRAFDEVFDERERLDETGTTGPVPELPKPGTH